MKLTKSVHIYLSDSRGQYIPRDFARDTKRNCLSNVTQADLDYLALGPGGCLDDCKELQDGETVRGEFYWDVWQDVCDNAVLTDPETGNKFRLHQDGDLFLVPTDWEWDDNSESFREPESETLCRFELFTYWASYLINGDASGLQEGEETQINEWLECEELTGWTCADVSERSWFAHSNDASTLGGDVAEYTFVRIK